MLIILGACCAFVASILLTALARHYAIRLNLMDVPNHRSSHSRVVPRGGGISIVITFIVISVLGKSFGYVNAHFASALCIGGSAIALVGVVDDSFHVAPAIRAAVHCLAAEWCVWQLGPLFYFTLGSTNVLNLEWLANVITVLGIVWMINLYNFMDGIDGLAATEGLTVSTFIGVFLFTSGARALGALSWMLAAACGGFLVWNWPPAKVFMGDVGSGFMGFAFAVLMVASAKEDLRILWPWMILLLVFLVDATVTLVRRVSTGARWYEAHRSHGYQHLARLWNSHLNTIITIAVVNCFWLLPLACVAFTWKPIGPIAATVAAIPLVWVCVKCRAGEEREI